MKLYIPVFLAIIVLCTPCFAQTIPFQSHSFNDLNYIVQQLKKGIDSFKIDINHATKEACETYSTWSGSENDCYDDQYSHKICCLAIKGDTSSAPALSDYFNTTSDLVNLLKNDKLSSIWSKDLRLPRYNRTIYIAMNIQYTYTGSLAKHWTLTKDWLATLIQTIEQQNLDIKIILGRSAILDYYGPLCASQSSECDANAQAIIDHNFALQGDKYDMNATTYGVIENFNIPFPSLSNFCSNAFPAYGDSLPYFFYEVAHEIDIQNIYNEYTSDKCNKRASHSDLSTVRITSNTDPEMLQNYMPRTNPLANLKSVTNSLVEVLDQDNLLYSYLDTNSGLTHIQIRSLKSSSFMNLLSEVTIQNTSIVKMSYKSSYLLLQDQAGIQLYSLSYNPNLLLQTVYTVSGSFLASDFVVLDDVSYIIRVVAGSESDANTLTFVIENTNTQEIIYNEGVTSTLPFDINEIQSAKLSAILNDSNDVRAILFVSATYTNLGQDKDALFAYTIRASLSAQVFSMYAATTYIDFGVDPDVKLFEDDSHNILVLEAHSNGLCQCADYLNNGNTYKCGIPNTQNAHIAYFQNMEHMMNYNWGRLDDFEERITSGHFLSACDVNIMHAKFSNGDKPSGIVYRDDASGFLQALFVNEHVNYEYLPIQTKLFCGSTLMELAGNSGVAVDVNKFNVVDYDLFEYF